MPKSCGVYFVISTSEMSKIIFGFFVSIILLVLIGVYASIHTNNYQDASNRVNHTQEVISGIQNILSYVQDMESASRGYVITGKDKYLEPYFNAKQNIENTFSHVILLTRENTSDISLYDSLHILIGLKLAVTQKTISAREEKGFEAAQQVVSTEVGRKLMDNTRFIISEIIKNEKERLTIYLKDSRRGFVFVITVIIVSIVISVLIIIAAILFFIRDYNRRLKAENDLRENELMTRKFLEALPVGVFVLGIDGKPYYSNQKSEEILGKSIVPGSSSPLLSEIFRVFESGSNTLYPDEKMPIVRALSGEKNISAEDLEIIRDGRRIPLRMNASSVFDSYGKIAYAVAVFDDITDKKKTEHDLAQAKHVVEGSVLLNQTFHINMTRAVEAQRRAVTGLISSFNEEKIAGSIMEYFNTLKSSGDTLQKIMEDVVGVLKIQAGMMTMDQSSSSVKEIFRSLGAMLSKKESEKGKNGGP